MNSVSNSNRSAPTRREKVAEALAEHAHVCIIISIAAVAALYATNHSFGSETQAALVGDITQLIVASIGFTGSGLALVMIALLKSADFGKLEKFQAYIILGIGVSTFVSGVAVLNSLGLLVFTHT
jgi:hypothetical protein